MLPAEDFADAFIGRKATEWIRDVPETHPWMMFVNFVGPHSPFDPPTEYADRYRNTPMPEVVPTVEEPKIEPEELLIGFGAMSLQLDDGAKAALDALMATPAWAACQQRWTWSTWMSRTPRAGSGGRRHSRQWRCSPDPVS